MKHDSFNKYPADSLDLPDRALLTMWDSLAAYHDELVLIGGLAVRHLTRPPAEGMPGPVTLDVDMGISIGASGGQYGGIRETLSAHGFQWEAKRFVRRVGELNLYLDLLTDDGQRDGGAVIVDDGLSVGIFPGVARALERFRLVKVSGQTLLGTRQTQNIRVAEVGPLLVLKLNAFGGPLGRKAPKDAHDILYLALHYLDGASAAIAAFKEEQGANNRGMAHALRCLEACFLNQNSEGPLACAAFRLNNQHLLPAFEEESLQIRQQCVSLAQALLS